MDGIRSKIVLAILIALMALLAGIDVVMDIVDGAPAHHAVIEGFVVLLGLVGLGGLVQRVLQQVRTEAALRQRAATLTADLESSRQEAKRWRDEAAEILAGLAKAIDGQFTRWSLTPAEREVALLLLKGLSHKEIGIVRSVGEATVRQQARTLYQKAGVAGRHDLSAFFLEDLLLPSARATEEVDAS